MSDQPAQPNKKAEEVVVKAKVEDLDTPVAAPATPVEAPTTPVDETKDLGQNQKPVQETKKEAKKPGLVVKDLDLDDKKSAQKSKDSMNIKMTKKQLSSVVVLSLVAILAGVGTGFGGYKLQVRSSGGVDENSPVAEQQVAGDVINNGDVFGIKDDKTFKDSAEGYLEEGGIDGEGSHKLLREGGISQTVYLTSSITDLDKLVGMQVKVWGETFKGQKAGWLMDVGRIQVIEMDAESPEAE